MYYPANERYNPPVPLKAAGLVVHGLNLDPKAMNDLTYFMALQGLLVYRGALLGHRVKLSEYQDVTRQGWLEEIVELHRLGRADNPHLPMVCAGFSLGALLILDAQSQGMISCDQMILLAPAAVTHVPHWVVSLARSVLPEMLALPSANPLAYRRHDQLVLKPNFLAYDSMKAVSEADPKKLNVPTLVLMSKQDEVVSYDGVKNWISSRGLSNWVFEDLTVEGTQHKKQVHHLIVDEASLGTVEWKRVTNKIADFMRPLTQAEPR